MKKANTTINFTNNTATMCEQLLHLDLTSSGHYFIDILPKTVEINYITFSSNDKKQDS